MLLSRTYLKILFLIFGVFFLSTLAYANFFERKYPIPLTSHISFDAKLKFIRDSIDVDSIDTLIIGSSLALNNIDGVVLENSSTKSSNVLNFSAYGVSALQAEQIMQLSSAFPHLKRIIYSAQYSDFPHGNKIFEDFNTELLLRYITNTLYPLEYQAIILDACKDLSFCIKRQKIWEQEHMKNNKFSYLGFDPTGSAILEIYGKDIINHRWNLPQPGIMHDNSFKALDRMSKKAKFDGVKFYLVQQPYREGLAKRPKVKGALEYFAKKCQAIMAQNDGYFLSLHKELNLSDKYFADRSHLNAKGSAVVANALGEFIDKKEK